MQACGRHDQQHSQPDAPDASCDRHNYLLQLRSLPAVHILCHVSADPDCLWEGSTSGSQIQIARQFPAAQFVQSPSHDPSTAFTEGKLPSASAHRSVEADKSAMTTPTDKSRKTECLLKTELHGLYE